MAEGVVLLYTIHDVFKLQRELEGVGMKVKAIPTPRHLSSDCGTALRFPWDEVERVRELGDRLDLDLQGIHEL